MNYALKELRLKRQKMFYFLTDSWSLVDHQLCHDQGRFGIVIFKILFYLKIVEKSLLEITREACNSQSQNATFNPAQNHLISSKQELFITCKYDKNFVTDNLSISLVNQVLDSYFSCFR